MLEKIDLIVFSILAIAFNLLFSIDGYQIQNGSIVFGALLAIRVILSPNLCKLVTRFR